MNAPRIPAFAENDFLHLGSGRRAEPGQLELAVVDGYGVTIAQPGVQEPGGPAQGRVLTRIISVSVYGFPGDDVLNRPSGAGISQSVGEHAHAPGQNGNGPSQGGRPAQTAAEPANRITRRSDDGQRSEKNDVARGAGPAGG